MKINRKLSVHGKRLLALLLAVTMVTGTLPSSVVYAAEVPAADMEDVGTGLPDDIAVDDVTSGNVEDTDVSDADPAVLEADGGTGEYAAGEPAQIQYTFDRTEFDEEYKTALPYGTYEISRWTYQVQKKVHVLADGKDRGTLEYVKNYDIITWESKWQVREETGWTDCSAPGYQSKVGSYQLIITIPAVEGVSSEAKLEMPFEITKAEIEPEVTIAPVTPGTLAQSVKAASAYISTTNDYFSYDEDAAVTDFTLSLSIKDAYTGAVVASELLKTGDYVAEITPAFTEQVTKEQRDSYTLKPVTQKIQMAGLITPEVDVTMSDKWKDKDNEGAYLDYSVVFTGETAVAPAAPEDYALKVQYWDGSSFNEDNTKKYTQVSFAAEDLTYEWYDSEYHKLDSVPVNAGTYYYRINYNGKTGLYTSNYAEIKVVVMPKKLTLAPKWKTETAPVFYPGMTVREVLAAVDYVARDEAGAEAAIDRDHIWGDYTGSGATIPFEPVFKLQVETDEVDADNKKLYADVSDKILEYNKPYRVIFSGEKAVYWGDSGSDAARKILINSTLYGADINYEVKVDEEVLNVNTLAVVMAAGSVAAIDVSKIPALEGTQADKAGATYENPYVKVYDGKQLYEERANYKQAEVKGADGSVIASGVDQKISYIWYRQSGTDQNYNGETGKYETVPRWTLVGSYNTIPSNAGNFSNAGNYKLVVSYADPTNVNHAVPVEVFYRIEKQKIKVVPKMGPAALTDTDIDKYDFSQITYEIQTVAASGEGEVLAWTEGKADEVAANEKDFYIDWKIEQKAENDAEFSSAYGVFTKGTSYRVAVARLNLRSSLRTNYTDFEYVTEGTSDAAVTTTRYLNETLAITLNEMGTTELKIEVDGNKLTDKVYDGKAYVIPEGAVKITKADGSAVADVQPEYRWEYDSYYEEDGEFIEPIHGGGYTLYVSYGGSTAYKAAAEQLVGSFRIKPKDILVEAKVDVEVKAGSYSEYYDFPLEFEGVEECDKDAFNWHGTDMDASGFGEGYYPAMSDVSTSVKDEDNKDVWLYKGGKTYTVFVEGNLTSRYARDYTVQSKGRSFTAVRDNSTVSAVRYGSISEVAITDTITGMAHVIKPEQGIDYINNYTLSNYDNKSVSGNYIAFRIYMPAEYRDDIRKVWDNAFFKNSIEDVAKSGGYVLDYADGSSRYANYITVAFDASAKDKKEFQIRWEEGYIETFTVDFSAAILGADLTKAVEPKSIAFNAPAKKMVVGGEQALDVKLTKKLQNDIICLQYDVSDRKVLHIDKDGYVVALDSGKADVTVTPVREDEDGNLVPIPGAKSAKVTITVTDVTAPKIQKLVALDDRAVVTYGQVSDGFRREVYVIKEKNVKADVFESRITSMTNENWEGLFAVAPAYYYPADWTIAEWRNKQAVYTIDGLEPNAEYTVYVRNVSQARTLEDDCRVTVSGKGSVKSFKTTRHQVKSLLTGFDYGVDEPVQYYGYDAEEDYDYTSVEAYGHYEVKLSAGSIKAYAMGSFQKLPVYDAADMVDTIMVDLPIKDAVQKKTYVAPKLMYQVAQRIYEPDYAPDSWYDYAGDYYYIPTPYASVDKAGKLKLSGVATVYVRVLDMTTGVVSDWRRLEIKATPDSIAAKNLTFEVGQSMRLTDLVDYKEGKLVLKGYFNRHIVYDQELKKAVDESPYFEMAGDWGITAVKPGGSLTLTLKDLYCGLDKSAAVTVKTKALPAATGLKASFLVDNAATMSFNYNGRANKFKVEVTDGRGRIIDSKLYNKSDFANMTHEYELGYDMSNYDSGNYYYIDAKGKNYYFFHINGLAKLSGYSVTVTAIWQNDDSTICESSKPAKKAIKTTKMPASYSYLHKDGLSQSRGGVAIYRYGRNQSSGSSLQDGGTPFSSGNTYELYVGNGNFALNRYAKNMLSDTLTWTSSNKKVATIKTNAGSYTASLKAVKAGYTVIEVKSKLTKKVIARYGVYVSAMGTARYNYFGENERQTFSLAHLSGRTDALENGAAAADYSFSTAIEGTDSGNTYTFTAPADGTYTFWTDGSSNICGTLLDKEGKILTYSDGGAADMNFKLSYELTAGEQVSLDVREWTFGDFAATLNVSAE